MILPGRLTLEWSQLTIFPKKTNMSIKIDPPWKTYDRMISANSLLQNTIIIPRHDPSRKTYSRWSQGTIFHRKLPWPQEWSSQECWPRMISANRLPLEHLPDPEAWFSKNVHARVISANDIPQEEYKDPKIWSSQKVYSRRYQLTISHRRPPWSL